ncbi:SMI1/KNR4 family protein, partial [Parasediminibacterium sp. JCM 36343]|uniref:SMI1/KNR4 family protein n=1 Tax=Parasediminibacterium sp. JCM 36343 TaxID=3374279 RepID=UPI003978B6D9
RPFYMTLSDLKLKHDKLKKLDGGGLFKRATYKTFGSDTHEYKFNSRLTEDPLKSFEKSFVLTLPTDYRNFLTQIGNGGSGPAYGLLPLFDWNIELEISDNNFLSTDFPHIDKWNDTQDFEIDDEDYTETEEFQKWEEEYFSNKHITGSIRICHYGCAIYYLLVVTGNNTGQIWVDDRANNNGIYPSISKSTSRRLTFFEWYDEWLTESLSQLA